MFVFDIGVSEVNRNIFKHNLKWRTNSKHQSLQVKECSVVVDILVENKYVVHFQTWYGC